MPQAECFDPKRSSRVCKKACRKTDIDAFSACQKRTPKSTNFRGNEAHVRFRDTQRDGFGNSSRCNLIETISVDDWLHSAEYVSLFRPTGLCCKTCPPTPESSRQNLRARWPSRSKILRVTRGAGPRLTHQCRVGCCIQAQLRLQSCQRRPV